MAKLRKKETTRRTRIDKDVKTTLRQSRVLSFLYDLMWSYRHFKYLALALLLADAVLGYLIIQYILCAFYHSFSIVVWTCARARAYVVPRFDVCKPL